MFDNSKVSVYYMSMTNHGKKIIAPVVVTICLIAYNILIAGLISFDMPDIIRITIAAVSVIVSVVLICVLIQRIKEIKKGEEDDLGKY